MKRAVGYISLLGIAVVLLGGFQSEVIIARRRAAAAGGSVWSVAQHPSNNACASSSATCAVTLTQSIPTSAQHVGVLVAMYNNVTARTLTGTVGGTYTTCTNCQNLLSSNSRTTIAYTLGTTASAGPLTCTLSQASTGGWLCEYIELATTGTSPVLNTGATPSGQATLATNTCQPGVALALSANTGVIVQTNFSFGTTTVFKTGSTCAGSTLTADFPSGDGIGWILNTTSGAQPSWTQTNATSGTSAIAFESTP